MANIVDIMVKKGREKSIFIIEKVAECRDRYFTTAIIEEHIHLKKIIRTIFNDLVCLGRKKSVLNNSFHTVKPSLTQTYF